MSPLAVTVMPTSTLRVTGLCAGANLRVVEPFDSVPKDCLAFGRDLAVALGLTLAWWRGAILLVLG
jgi:hypothetical protein